MGKTQKEGEKNMMEEGSLHKQLRTSFNFFFLSSCLFFLFVSPPPPSFPFVVVVVTFLLNPLHLLQLSLRTLFFFFTHLTPNGVSLVWVI